MDIRTPLPGMFFRRPSPDQPPYKQDGDAVAKGEVIGLVEVMKSFHEITSQADGVIASFLVENEQPVRAGQVVATVAEAEDG